MNDTIFYFFYSLAHKSAPLDRLIIFLAVYLPYLVAAAAVLFLFIHPDVSPAKNVIRNFIDRVKEGCLVCVSCLLAWLVAFCLKHLFKVPRPPLSLSGVHSLFVETGYSFPSAHALFFSAIAVSIFFINRKAGYWFMFCALIIGLARIVAGVHFPADILGGFIIGSLVAYFVKSV
jgi:undecaprenyl-diphosphatase